MLAQAKRGKGPAGSQRALSELVSQILLTEVRQGLDLQWGGSLCSEQDSRFAFRNR